MCVCMLQTFTQERFRGKRMDFMHWHVTKSFLFQMPWSSQSFGGVKTSSCACSRLRRCRRRTHGSHVVEPYVVFVVLPPWLEGSSCNYSAFFVVFIFSSNHSTHSSNEMSLFGAWSQSHMEPKGGSSVDIERKKTERIRELESKTLYCFGPLSPFIYIYHV